MKSGKSSTDKAKENTSSQKNQRRKIIKKVKVTSTSDLYQRKKSYKAKYNIKSNDTTIQHKNLSPHKVNISNIKKNKSFYNKKKIIIIQLKMTH